MKRSKVPPAFYYTIEEKMVARKAVYALLAPMAPGPLQLMPGGITLETNVAVEAGFPLEQHHVLDLSPAVKADFTRAVKKEFGSTPEKLGIKYKRMLASRASWQWSAEGVKITAANLDFTGNLDSFKSGSVFSELDEWCASCIMPKGRIAIWILSGREVKVKYAKQGRKNLNVKKANQRRIATLLHRLDVGLTRSAKPRIATLIDKGSYHNENSSNTMLWAVFEIKPKIRGGKNG